MKKIIVLLVAAALLATAASAYEIPADLTGQSLEQVLGDYMAANGLHEGNFSFSYYNTVTEEAYAFNDTAFMTAASTFKLPLNMYYYEMERDGQIESDAMIPEAGVPLNIAHQESLVNSNNEYSIGMLYHLGDFRTYKTLLRERYFSMPEEEIHYTYYVDNYFCTNMMMDALKYLYEHSDDFEEMLDYMKQAQPEEYFRAGVTEYEVAHKYGWYDGTVNDVGIIYTEEPFLLAVYTQGVCGETVVADTAALVTAWNMANLTPSEPEPEPAPETEGQTLEIQMVPVEKPEAPSEPEQPADPLPEPEPAPAEPVAFEWWMIAVALGVFVLGGGGTLLVFNNKHLKKMRVDETEEEEEWIS